MPAASTATLRFLPDWQQVQDGEIVAGGTLRIEYTADRTLQAFADPGGVTPPNVEAHLIFEPGGQHLMGSVAAELEVPVPEDARGVAVWFQATDRDRTTAWDSQYGENYRFPVVPPTPSASRGTSSGTSRPSARSRPGNTPRMGSARSSGGGTPRQGRTGRAARLP